MPQRGVLRGDDYLTQGSANCGTQSSCENLNILFLIHIDIFETCQQLQTAPSVLLIWRVVALIVYIPLFRFSEIHHCIALNSFRLDKTLATRNPALRL
jgi:hypothetical protein